MQIRAAVGRSGVDIDDQIRFLAHGTQAAFEPFAFISADHNNANSIKMRYHAGIRSTDCLI